MASEVVTIAADGTLSKAGAGIADIFTTLIDPDKALTGAYKYVQLAGVGLAGAMVQNYRLNGSAFKF